MNKDVTGFLRQPVALGEPGLTAQVIGTGRTVRYSAVPEVFYKAEFPAAGQLFLKFYWWRTG